MYPADATGTPTPLSSLDDLVEQGTATEKPEKVFMGHNLGFRSFLMSMPLRDFFEMSAVSSDPGNDPSLVSQRKLDPAHAQKLAVYILKGLVQASIHRRGDIEKKQVPAEWLRLQDVVGKQPYMTLQPIVVNIRECSPAGSNLRGHRMLTTDNETAAFKVFLSQRHVLWVVDGQHRRKAMEYVFDFLEQVRTTGKYPKKGGLVGAGEDSITTDGAALWEECFNVARAFCTIAVEVHLGLSVEQERQLFHDLNRLGKKVETSLALQFDSSNPVNLFIKERLISDLGLKVAEKDQKDWHKDTGDLSRKDVVAINAILFLNKTNINGATPAVVSPRVDVAYRFWEAVSAIPGIEEDQAREKTVAAQPVVLKALAKLAFDFGFSSRRADNADDLLEILLNGITDLDFRHDNPMWRYFELAPDQREAALPGLGAYLATTDGSTNRDIGGFQGGFMRFGAKHNDIYPILGDMIRWKLALPNRHAQAE